jgi:hypothetical protein
MVENAGISVVLPAVQEDCVLRPVSSGEMCLRHPRADGVFLPILREVEHFPKTVLALCRLFVEGH